MSNLVESYKVVLHALVDEAECDSINGPILGVYVPDFPIFYVECAISDHVDRLSSMVASSDDFLELKNTSTEQILMTIRLYQLSPMWLCGHRASLHCSMPSSRCKFH